MRNVSMLVILFVVLAFAHPASAQDCASIPDCAANIAGDKARRAEFERATVVAVQATAAVVATERAEQRQISAAATRAAQPTATSRPTETPTKTSTPIPTATATMQPTSTQAVQIVPVAALPIEPQSAQPWWVSLTVRILGGMAGLALMAWALAGLRRTRNR